MQAEKKFDIKRLGWNIRMKISLGGIMNKRLVLAGLCIAIAICVIPGDLLANTVNTIKVAGIETEVDKIKNFLFSWPLRIGALFGAAYGGVQSVLTASPSKFFAYGAVALGVNLLEPFVDAIFPVSSMLIP